MIPIRTLVFIIQKCEGSNFCMRHIVWFECVTIDDSATIIIFSAEYRFQIDRSQ